MSIPVTLAVEDILSEAVARQMMADANPLLVVDQVIGHQGYGFLKLKLRALNQAAHNGVVSVVVADLDAHETPELLRRSWLDLDLHPNLIFRVAVREIEAWLLADAIGMSEFLGIPEGRIPVDIERVGNPKELVVNLARRSRKASIKKALVPGVGSSSCVGLEYNDFMLGYTRSHWSLARAMERSESMRRAHAAIREFQFVA